MKKTLFISALLLSLSTQSLASNIEIVGTIPQNIATSPQGLSSYGKAQDKTVLLQKIKLSANAKKQLQLNIKSQLQKPFREASSSNDETAVNLGMANTPVLDQGRHGSCVTFASAGALDALLQKGDYVSELCSLSLGKYFEEKNGSPSGWDGSWGYLVLKQMFKYGVVSIETQKQHRCGGLKYYPKRRANKTGGTMSPTEYQDLSETIADKFAWRSVLHVNSALDKKTDGEQLLQRAKAQLIAGNRLTFGVLLDVDQGYAGAVGKYHQSHDTWMLTKAIEEDAEEGRINAGHEMIIIGYDDDATVRANNGESNKGLLILRNSWGKSAGDYGNYYMSYDYFKAMVMEIHALYTI